MGLTKEMILSRAEEYGIEAEGKDIKEVLDVVLEHIDENKIEDGDSVDFYNDGIDVLDGSAEVEGETEETETDNNQTEVTTETEEKGEKEMKEMEEKVKGKGTKPPVKGKASKGKASGKGKETPAPAKEEKPKGKATTTGKKDMKSLKDRVDQAKKEADQRKKSGEVKPKKKGGGGGGGEKDKYGFRVGSKASEVAALFATGKYSMKEVMEKMGATNHFHVVLKQMKERGFKVSYDDKSKIKIG